MRQVALCLSALLVVVWICGQGGVAHAEGGKVAYRPNDAKNWALDLEVGGPVPPNGVVGVAVTRLFGEYVGLTGGLGFRGVSLMPKVQIVDRRVAFGLRVGPSVSIGFTELYSRNLSDDSLQESGLLCGLFGSECITARVDGPVVWGHADFSMVYQEDDGLRLGAMVGFSSILYSGGVEFESDYEGVLPEYGVESISVQNQPYAGLIFGWLF